MFNINSPQVARIAYTLSQALTAAFSVFNDVCPTNRWAGIVVGAGAGASAAPMAYYFQGEAMVKPARDGYMEINDNGVTPNICAGEACPPHRYGSWRHYCAEIGLNTTSAAFTLANRYFLVTSLFTVFGFSTAARIVWPVVVCDSAFKMLFDLTNELYETNGALATYMNAGVKAKPIYANWQCTKTVLAHEKVRDILTIVGTLEHSIADDILPWLLFIPENALAGLANAYRNFALASTVARAFAIIIPILGSFLACIIIFQTILFEAEHSYEAYRDILTEKTDEIESWFERMRLRPFAARLLYHGTWLMPLCHGAAAAAPVYVGMKKLFSLDSDDMFVHTSFLDVLAILGTLVITLLAFVGTFRGHQISEMKEAQNLLRTRF